MLTWAQIAIGILYSGIAHERQPNFRHRKKNKTPAQAFTPPADEKKCVLRKVLRRLRLKQGQMQELFGLMAGGGVLICKYGI